MTHDSKDSGECATNGHLVSQDTGRCRWCGERQGPSLLERVEALEAASKDGFAVQVSWKDMYEDAERRVKVWRERYERRFQEREAVDDVVSAARTFIRGNQTGATATARKRKLRSALRALDAAEKAVRRVG